MSITDSLGPLATTIPPEKPLSFFEALRVARENGMATIPRAAYETPVYELSNLFGRGFLISDPGGIKRVLLDNVANYPKAPMETEILAAAFGEGLLTSDGEKWRAHRRIMAPSFDHRSIVSYAPAMTEAALGFVDHWAAGQTVDIAAEMTKLTLQIISRTMFSADSESVRDLLATTFQRGMKAMDFGLAEMLPIIGPINIRRKIANIRQIFAALDAAMYGLIEARAKAPADAPSDLLGRLVAARDSETGGGMTDKEVRDEVVIIFIAGHETTAVAMTFVWYLLSQHPGVEAKLHQELDSVLAGRAPAYEDIEKLAYTRMVIEESMRLYPPAPGLSVRQAQAADEIAGHAIPKGASIMIAPWVLHRHRLLWDNPDAFDPDRFSAERSKSRPRFAYLPFGGGPRICIGATLAMTEATLILATIAQRFRLSLIPDQDIKLQARITLRPRDGIRMSVAPRAA
jgi:cytochrome P450